jgi:integrase
MNPEEVKRFLKVATGSIFHHVFYLALFTGMRRGEILGLRWRDVDLDKAKVSIVQNLQRLPGRGFIIQEPKSSKGRRQVTLSPSATLMLREHRMQAQAARVLLGRTLREDDLVFSHPDGSPVDPDSVSHAFIRIAHKAGLPGTRLHDLRHTHASLMLKAGVHPKVVSERLGHATISITLDTYSHVLPGIQEAAALLFEEGLLGLPSGAPVHALGN